jgi:ketol-acid reductoisomerase
VAAGIQGMSKALNTASQVGKANGTGAIKTLGAAQKVEWDKKVDETKGGKLAKDILATVPKPKKTTSRKPKKDTDEEIIGNA